MKLRRKLLVPTALLALSLPLTANAATSFEGVSPRFLDEVKYLEHRGIIQGYSNGLFGASGTVTRAQAVAMIMREIRVMSANPPNPGFTDMTGTSGFYKVVSESVSLGIIQGKVAKDGSRYFDPNGSLTRSEMAQILTRAYKIPTDRRDIGFKDVPKSINAKDSINAIVLGGASMGYEDGTFRPYEKITREHFSVFLARLLERQFNPMGHQFIPDEELDLDRPEVKWHTEDELAIQENEMISLLNSKRKDAGLFALKADEQLMHLANIKARGFSEYPNTDHAFALFEDFYESEFGKKPSGSINITEVVGAKDFPTVLNNIMSTPEYKHALYSKNNVKIGVGAAQDIDGTFQWVLFISDEK